jgi:hypothetical protein
VAGKTVKVTSTLLVRRVVEVIEAAGFHPTPGN